MWLDHHSNKKYGKSFMDCSEDQQLETLDLIAYPDLSIDSDDQKQEVVSEVLQVLSTLLSA